MILTIMDRTCLLANVSQHAKEPTVSIRSIYTLIAAGVAQAKNRMMGKMRDAGMHVERIALDLLPVSESQNIFSVASLFVLSALYSHAVSTPAASQVYANVQRWRTPEVQISKEPCASISILLRQYAK